MEIMTFEFSIYRGWRWKYIERILCIVQLRNVKKKKKGKEKENIWEIWQKNKTNLVWNVGPEPTASALPEYMPDKQIHRLHPRPTEFTSSNNKELKEGGEP